MFLVHVHARSARRTLLRLSVCGLISGFSVSAAGDAARAENLRQALASAYMTNPTLNAKRAELRAIDEEISQARSNFRPSVSADLDSGYRKFNPNPKDKELRAAAGTHHPKGYAITVNKTLFRGLRTINAIREAEATIQAARADLRSTEQSVLLDAVTAYMDVLRDQAIVRLREGNVRVLAEQLKATKDRFEVGEVTKTDVAQAEARRSGAISQLNLAQSNLKTSRAAYQRVIGHAPSHVVEPQSIESHLPRLLTGALRTAEDENPDIQSALYSEEASRYAIKQIIGEMLPEVSVEARYEDALEPSLTLDGQSSTTLTGRVRVPLYSKGEPSSRARQARETNRQRLQQIDEARAQANADVIAAWGRLMASRAQIESDREQVRANKIALNGVREEEKVGQRTILDVLDAEQELLDSQVALVGTQRDRVVAGFTLLAAVGRLDAHFLRLSVEHYDPIEHSERIKHRLFGTNPDRRGLLGR
jgi:outer membrane protein